MFISKVVPDGPSEQAGLQVGDKLLMVSEIVFLYCICIAMRSCLDVFVCIYVYIY